MDLLWQDTFEGCQFFFIARCCFNCTGYRPEDEGTGADMKVSETIGTLMDFHGTIHYYNAPAFLTPGNIPYKHSKTRRFGEGKFSSS